jgi:hypothetical protein
MFTLYNGLTVLLTAVLAAGSGVLLLDRSTPDGRWHGVVSRTLQRWLGRTALERLDWRPIALVVAIGYAAIAGFDLATGLYNCHGNGGAADLIGLLHSGRAFWTGSDPFTVPDCGASITVPYGLAAILLDAVGSLGGMVGIAAVWGVVAVAVIPLIWSVAGADRRYVTVVVATLPIYFPLISSQIDGASNAIVPVAVLLSLVLAARSEPLAQALGGFLSSARFPSLFPVVALAGPSRRRFLGAATALAAFGAAMAVAYAVWGSEFYRVVFGSQLTRRSFSLNVYGVLLDHGWLPTAEWIVGLQAALTLAVMGYAFFRARSALAAAAITLTGFALLTPFLSFSILVSLLPIVLVGTRARWWLWGTAVVGAMNYDLALNVLAWQRGLYAPTDILDVLLTALLLGLFIELVKGTAHASPSQRGRESLDRSATGGASAAGPGVASGREVEAHFAARLETQTLVDRATGP